MEIFLIIGLVLFGIIVGTYIGVYNKVKTFVVKIDEADSGIDVALTKRYNVLTQMIEVVKGYAKYEAETLAKLVSLRSGMSIDEKNQVNHAMSESFNKIHMIAESYPDLKANNNFIMLQKAIADVEEHLQAARRLYNSNISLYNQFVITFPTNMIAGMMSAKPRGFFEADDVSKANVNINF